MTSTKRILLGLVLLAGVAPAGAYRSGVNVVDDAGEQQVFNVRAFGAKGDGTAIDTTAFRAALAAGAGATVDVPPGTYRLAPVTAGSSQGPILPLAANTTLRCAAGAVLKLDDSSYAAGGLDLSEARMAANMTAAGAWVDGTNITIDGCTFDGNAENNGTFTGGVPLVQCAAGGSSGPACHNFTVKNSTFIGCSYGCLWIFNGSGHVIRDNVFHSAGQEASQNSDCVQVNGATDVSITGNVMTNTDEAIAVQHATGAPRTPARRVRIAGNRIADVPANDLCTSSGKPYTCCTGWKQGSSVGRCAAGQTLGSAIILLAQDAVVDGNILQNDDQIAIQAGRGDGTAGDTAFDTTNVVVSNNVNTAPTANGILLLVNDEEVRCTGSGTPLACCTGAGAGATCVDRSLTNVIVTGNHVSATPASTSCVQLVPTTSKAPSDVAILGNTCVASCASGTCAGGVFFDSIASAAAFTDILIAGNRVVDSGRYAFWVEGPTSNVRIRQNVLENNTNGPFNFASGDFAEWSFNSAVTNAQLSTLATNSVGNGSMTYCSDCTIANPCAGSGTGALAKRLNGAWVCN